MQGGDGPQGSVADVPAARECKSPVVAAGQDAVADADFGFVAVALQGEPVGGDGAVGDPIGVGAVVQGVDGGAVGGDEDRCEPVALAFLPAGEGVL